jgi:hypothetical protein
MDQMEHSVLALLAVAAEPVAVKKKPHTLELAQQVCKTS